MILRTLSVVGDTRYDQVSNGLNKNLSIIINNPCIILGSSWEKEEKLAAEIIQKTENINWVIVPHEIQDHKLRKTKALLEIIVHCFQILI